MIKLNDAQALGDLFSLEFGLKNLDLRNCGLENEVDTYIHIYRFHVFKQEGYRKLNV